MVYAYVCISSVFFAYLAQRSKNKTLIFIFSAISILIPSIVGGLRAHGVGRDTEVYGRRSFLAAIEAPDIQTFVFDGSPEIGFKFLCYVVANTFGHENWCYFVYQIITLTCVYIGTYKHKDKLSMPFTMFVWFILFYGDTYNTMRQTLACSIIFMNLDKLETKHYWKFGLAIAFAALFHTSAVIVYVLLIGIHAVITSKILKHNFWLKFLVLYGSLATFLLLKPIMTFIINNYSLFSKYTNYTSNASMSLNLAGYKSVMMLFLGEVIMLLLYGKRAPRLFITKNEIQNFEFFRYNLLFCIVFIFTIHAMAYRILMYQYYVNALLLAALPRLIREKHLRFLVMMVLVIVLVFYWWNIIVNRGNSAVWPYRSIL